MKPWADFAWTFMARVKIIGLKAAASEPQAKRLSDDPWWHRSLDAWAAGLEPPKPPRGHGVVTAEGDRTYACLTCHDSGFRLRVDEAGVAWSNHCGCETGTELAHAHRSARLQREAKEQRRLRRIVEAIDDEDPPI